VDTGEGHEQVTAAVFAYVALDEAGAPSAGDAARLVTRIALVVKRRAARGPW